jgi:hypothetical protein
LTKVNLKGFPSEINKPIELPNIGELLMQPMFLDASIDNAYKYGGDFYRKLLYLAPLKRDKRHISITSYVQLLSPGDRSVFNKIGYENEWHVDGEGMPFHQQDRMHLLISDCTARTEFSLNSIDVDVDEKINYTDFNKFLNENQEKIGLIPKKIEPNRFITFDNHPHRATNPQEHEYRFYVRIIESTNNRSKPLEESMKKYSNVYKDGKSIKNIELKKNGMLININND